MPIYTIPSISINGQGGQLGNPFFGGYIYNLNYNLNVGSEGSSTLTVNLVSEDGQYSFNPSNLQIQQAYNIQIGNMHFNMYPKKLRKKYSAKGNLLELEFTDGSFILDKFFVGLSKKHGGYSTDPSCMIVVGREFHDCDINNNGTVNVEDVYDPCSVCAGGEQTQISLDLIDCGLKSLTKIFKVKYNFTNLMVALANRGFHLQGAFDPNPTYYNTHSGSLRSVLSSWCHDFGWIFFWDNGVIKFKDLRTIPMINAQIATFCPNIEEFEEEYSLDGTFNTMILSNYSREGENIEETCQEAKYLEMIPLTRENSLLGDTLEIVDIDKNAAGLCYYSKELRDLYYYFIDGDLGNINNFYPGNEIPKLGMTILSQPISIAGAGGGGSAGNDISDLSKLGQAPSLAFRNSVFDAPPHEDVSFLETNTLVQGSFLYEQRELIKANLEFLECFRLLDNESQWRVASHLANYFFFAAHYDEERDNKKAQEERDFAGGFIGKFWLYIPQNEESFFKDYTFFDDSYCGESMLKNDDRISYQFLGSGGGDSLDYFNNPGLDASGGLERISQLPFARFLKVLADSPPGSPGDVSRLQKMVCVSKGGEGYFPAPSNVELDDNLPSNENGNWLIQDQELINEAATFFPQVLPTKMNQAGENIMRLLLQQSANPDLDKNKMHIFLGFKNLTGAFSHNVSRGGNPAQRQFPPSFNGKPLNNKINPVTGLPEPSIVYQYPRLLCSQLGNESNECDVIIFTTPAGAFKYFTPTNSSYFSILEKTEKKTKRVRKVETVVTGGSCGFGSNALLTTVDVHSITDDDINKFLRIGSNSCVYNLDKINQLHNNFIRNLSIQQTSPLIKKVFTVDGIDIIGPLPTIDQGLQNISISADSQGIKTTYVFGTSHMLLPDVDVYSSNYNNVFVQKPIQNDVRLPRYNST